MPETALDLALSRAAADVLEKMFFAGVVEESSEDRSGPSSIAVRMGFDGERKGLLGLRISTDTARTLAADFLGLDAAEGPEEAQVHEVVRELANMICGDALSAVEKTPLCLSVPEIIPPADFALPGAGSYRCFDLGNGSLTVALAFEENTHG